MKSDLVLVVAAVVVTLNLPHSTVVVVVAAVTLNLSSNYVKSESSIQ